MTTHIPSQATDPSILVKDFLAAQLAGDRQAALRVPADALLGLDSAEAVARAVHAQQPQEDSPSVRRLLGLARKLDEAQVRVLIGMATALLR